MHPAIQEILCVNLGSYSLNDRTNSFKNIIHGTNAFYTVQFILLLIIARYWRGFVLIFLNPPFNGFFIVVSSAGFFTSFQ